MEMCIRDRCSTDRHDSGAAAFRSVRLSKGCRSEDSDRAVKAACYIVRCRQSPVSYTHLTPVTENPAQLSTNRTSTETINKREKKEIQHRYGSYENVLLSDTEYGKLRQEFPGDYQMRVERLSEYMASTGRSYKNHLATIRSWAKREKPKYNPADYTFEEGDS